MHKKVSSKTGVFDDTVTIGDVNPARKWVPQLLAALLRHRTGDIFAGLSLGKHERLTRSAALELKIAFCPHQCRHGGPSADVLDGCLDLRQVQGRGRWTVPESVRRYAKHAKLLRVAANTPPEVSSIAATAQDGKLIISLLRSALSKRKVCD